MRCDKHGTSNRGKTYTPSHEKEKRDALQQTSTSSEEAHKQRGAWSPTNKSG
jgi:hypothetical protein